MISIEEARKILDPDGKRGLTDEYTKRLRGHLMWFINKVFDDLEKDSYKEQKD